MLKKVESVDIDETWKLQFICGETHPIPEWLSKELLRFNSVQNSRSNRKQEQVSKLAIDHKKGGEILNNNNNNVVFFIFEICISFNKKKHFFKVLRISKYEI